MRSGNLKVKIKIEGESAHSLRPRMGQPKKENTRSKSDLTRIKMLTRGFARNIGKKKYITERSSSRGRGNRIATPPKMAQRVIIKSRYLKMNNARSIGTSRAHINYITRDSVGIEGGEAIAFNNEQSFDKNELNQFIARGANSPHQFRLIVSPENGNNLDMQGFAKELINSMEGDLATKLDYVAVVHYDTNHPHIHFVINGKTDDNRELRISRNYLSNGIRARGSEIATHELGFRTEHELDISLEKEITAERFTSLDNKLLKLSEQAKVTEHAKIVELSSNKKIIDLAYIPKRMDQRFLKNRGILLARLNELESLGLAWEKKAGVWELENDFKGKLQELSRENEIVKRIESHIQDLSENHKALILENNQPVEEKIIGKVVGKGIVNELYDSKYMVIEGINGNAYYAQLTRYSEKEDKEAKLGDIVALDNRNTQTTGGAEHNAVNLSSKTGIYDINEHRVLIEAGIKKLPDGVTDIENYLERHVKRMKHLESKGLITKVKENAWNIPKDLIKNIENQLNETRKLFMRVELESTLTLNEQINARGLTALDKQIARNGYKTISHPNSRGFQKEFEMAMEKRIEALKSLDLAYEKDNTIVINKDFAQKLIDIEITDAVSKISLKHGAYIDFDKILISNLSEKTREFEGKLVEYVNLPSGKMAVVANFREFTLVPMEAGMSKLMGKEILLSSNKSVNVFRLNKELELNRIRFLELNREISLGF